MLERQKYLNFKKLVRWPKGLKKWKNMIVTKIINESDDNSADFITIKGL